MAIQLRRGAYADFDPQKMKPAEVAVVQEDDPTSHDGKAVYVAIRPGDVKRMAVLDELQDEVYNQIDTAISTATQAAVTTATQAAAESASEAAASASEAAESARTLTIDRTLTQPGQAADAKAVGDKIDDLSEALETEEERAKSEEERIEALFTQPVEEAVSSWLDEHPEATTTVQDGAITDVKLSDSLKLVTIKDYVTPEMFGAVGDGATDDSIPFETAVNTGKLVYCSKSYLITQKIKLIKGIDGFGTVIFSGLGCFTISVGTSLRNITFKTTNKCIDIVDTDITSPTAQNINARLLFENLTIICDSGADTIFSLVSTTYGFYNVVFKNINFTRECNLAVKLESDENVSTSWLNQVYFIDCLFASPLKVIEANRVDNIIFERCTTQKSSNNGSNLLYDFVNCKMASFINCHDWDYISTVKLYRFVNCRECELIGTDRTIENFDMTLNEWYDTFRIAQSKYSYSPQIYNVSHLVRSALGMESERFFIDPFVGYIMMPVHGVVGGESITAIRATNSQAGYYGKNSFDLAVTSQGKIKLRVRVLDTTSQDSDGHYHTKWSDWYTFTPDSQ